MDHTRRRRSNAYRDRDCVDDAEPASEGNACGLGLGRAGAAGDHLALDGVSANPLSQSAQPGFRCQCSFATGQHQLDPHDRMDRPRLHRCMVCVLHDATEPVADRQSLTANS